MCAFALLYNSWYVLFQVQPILMDAILQSGLHISAVSSENLPKYFMVPRMPAVLFYFSGSISVSDFSLCGCPEIISPIQL